MSTIIFNYDPDKHKHLVFTGDMYKNDDDLSLSGSMSYGLVEANTNILVGQQTFNTPSILPVSMSGSLDLSALGLTSGTAYRGFVSKTNITQSLNPLLEVVNPALSTSGSLGQTIAGDLYVQGSILADGTIRATKEVAWPWQITNVRFAATGKMFMGSQILEFSTGNIQLWAGVAIDKTLTITPTGSATNANLSVSGFVKATGNLGYMTIADGVDAPSTTAGHAHIYVDTVDGDLKIKFADGTIKTITTDS